MTEFDIEFPERRYEEPEVRLWRMVARGDVAGVEKILREDKPDLTMHWKEHTLLYHAVREDDIAVAELLLKAGASPDEPCTFLKYTPLMTASGNGNDAMVELLLKHHAKVDARSNADETAVHRAAWFGHDTVLQKLDAAGANVDAQNFLGQTALHCAVSSGHLYTVKTLLNLGADASLQDTDRRTPAAFGEGIPGRNNNTVDAHEMLSVLRAAEALETAARVGKLVQRGTGRPLKPLKKFSFKAPG